MEIIVLLIVIATFGLIYKLKTSKKIKDEEIKYGCMQSLDQLPTSQAQEINFAMCEKFKEFLPLAMIESHHED